MTWYRSFRLLLVLTAAACLNSPALAGTYRHDVDPSEYLSLALDYPSVGHVAGGWEVGGEVVGLFYASGVLIAPDWVLTAGHVVSPLRLTEAPYALPTAFGLFFDIDGFSWRKDGSLDWDDIVPVTHWIPHPEWELLAAEPVIGDLYDEYLEDALFAGYDIGLMKLESEIAGVTAKRYDGGEEVGETGVSVGYGWVGTGETGATDPPLILEDDTWQWHKLAGENVIDTSLGDFWPGGSMDVLLSDFDKPADSSKSSMGDDFPLDLEYLIAEGDSGGGLFIQDENGETVLAGIHSFIWGLIDDVPNSNYGDGSGHTRVSPFNDWINSTIPEPSSIIVWSLMIGLSAAGGWRRRRRA